MSDEDDELETQMALAVSESLKTYSAEQRRPVSPPKPRPRRHITIEQEIEAARNICRRVSVSTTTTPTKAPSVPVVVPKDLPTRSLIEEQNHAYSKALAIDAENARQLALENEAKEALANKLQDLHNIQVPDTESIPGETVSLAIRLPGKRATKAFKKTDSVFYVYVWIAQQFKDVLPEHVNVSELNSRSGNIQEAGITCNTLLGYTINKE